MSKFKWLYGKANLKKQNSKIKFLAQASSLDISKLDLVNKLCKECITNRSSKNKGCIYNKILEKKKIIVKIKVIINVLFIIKLLSKYIF